MNKLFFTVLGGLVLLGAGCTTGVAKESEQLTVSFDDQPVIETTTVNWTFPGVLPEEEIVGKTIRIQTDKGDIVFELFGDTAPKTVSNFVYLTTGGFYNGLTFHRREEGFVIQGGDPAGNGTGGPGYTFEDEFADDYTYQRGTVAMANRGPDTNGSQFFIMLSDVPLPKAYTIFGRVIEGMDIVDTIKIGDVMNAVSIEEVE